MERSLVVAGCTAVVAAVGREVETFERLAEVDVVHVCSSGGIDSRLVVKGLDLDGLLALTLLLRSLFLLDKVSSAGARGVLGTRLGMLGLRLVEERDLHELVIMETHAR